jgi:hypothetical protein
MPAAAKTLASAPALPAGEISLGALLEALRPSADRPLVFVYGGREVHPGYHVTEIKSGRFESLDCGALPEAWRETFIQLQDGAEEGRTHMPAGKFLAIVRKVEDALPLAAGSKLTFEVSDGAGPLQLYKARRVVAGERQLVVELVPRPASCKPRERGLAAQKEASACCGTAPAREPCCI